MAITVLDGGMGDEISARLEGAVTGLWSASALIEKPDLVVDIHKEYIEAGELSTGPRSSRRRSLTYI